MAEIIDFQLEKIKRQSKESIKYMIDLIDNLLETDSDVINGLDLNRQNKCIQSQDKALVIALSLDKSIAKYLEKDIPKFVEAKDRFYQKFGHMIED